MQLVKDFYHNSSWKLLLSLLLFVMAIAVFYMITDEIVIEKEGTLDEFIFHFFREHLLRESRTGFMFGITHFSSTSLMVIAFPLVLVIFSVFKLYRHAIFTFCAGVGGSLLVYFMKIFFARPRPPYPLLYKEESFSFPSGHSTFSFIFYGTLAYLIWLTDLSKVWKLIAMTFLISLSFTIGFSRIYLRVHYPSDVLGGFCLGYSWLFLIIYAFRKWCPLN